MKNLKWIMILLTLCMAGCNVKKDDGLTPTQPSYANQYFPNPLVLFDGSFSAGVGLIPPPSTLYLANYCAPPFGTYSYDLGVTIAIGDNVKASPYQGTGNLIFGVSTYSLSGNTCANYAELPIVPLDVNGKPTTLNLSTGLYTQATFDAMAQGVGGVTQTITFVAAGGSAAIPLTSAWKPCTVTLGGLTAVNVLFGINITSPAALPVTVYVDHLLYQ